MKIVLIGMNHKTAPVEVRERIGVICNRPDQPLVVAELLDMQGVKEGLFVSTCNRVEALFASDDLERAQKGVIKLLAQKFEYTEKELKEFIYILVGPEAVSHLFRVASSLDSMVVGEPQILGQIKDSYRQASQQKAAGVILNRLLHRAFFVAKRVRSETRIGNSAISISYAAVELAKKIFGELNSKKVMLIGAGEMAELAVKHLMRNGVKEIIVANRTLERAMELAESFGGRPTLLDEIGEHLLSVDIIISSTGAPGYVVHEHQVKNILRKRRNRPLFFVDIAVPRDVDPAINHIGNTYLYNIDELQGIVEINLEDRKAEAVQAERIVEEETIKFLQWLESLAVVPTIINLQEKSEEICKAELRKTLSQLKEMTPEQVEAIDILSRSIARKLLHHPIQFLKRKRTHKENREQDIDYMRKIFNLDHD